ncbi:MAG TPA: hypothetical protein VMN78_06520 [Longimicrobiales bacterium]|nr:hypothetical protein [Longimicrobiales bacterium]
MRPLLLLHAGIALALLFGVPHAARAQSLFGSRGLGIVVSPADGRTAALGGLGIALSGPAAALLNPADAAEVARRGVVVSMQPSVTEIETAGGTADVSATRFPLVQLHLPFGRRTVLSAGYGAFLDQNWGVTRRTIERFGSDSVTAVDRITSRGGIAQGRVGVAYDVSESFTVGGAIGFLTGSSSRVARRDFEDDGIGLAPFESEVETAYTAPLASVGVRWRAGSMVRVGGALTWIGELSSDAGDNETDVSMPLQAVGGASVQLLDDLLLAASARWTGWSATDDLNVTAEDVIEVGGGIEWTGIRANRRVFPVRLGARRGAQPFSFGAEAPVERAISFGLGARLAGSEESPAALVDFAIERGSRGDFEENELAERFWRATVSVSLFSL